MENEAKYLIEKYNCDPFYFKRLIDFIHGKFKETVDEGGFCQDLRRNISFQVAIGMMNNEGERTKNHDLIKELLEILLD